MTNCVECGGEIPDALRSTRRYCGGRCRSRAFSKRKMDETEQLKATIEEFKKKWKGNGQ